MRQQIKKNTQDINALGHLVIELQSAINSLADCLTRLNRGDVVKPGKPSALAKPRIEGTGAIQRREDDDG